jgi:hypothetical protein
MSRDAASPYARVNAASASGWTAARVLRTVMLHALCVALAIVLFAAYEHLAVHGQSPRSLACLVGAAVFALVPLRAVLAALFSVETRVLHLLHGVGGLFLACMPIFGFVHSGPVLTHAALAPFALMGGAQALTHANRPRNAEQAAAMQSFVSSLPEIEQITRSGDLTSPENAAREMTVLRDLISKAQKLGETELRSDPGFQSALQQVSARFGLTLGLDAADQALAQLAHNPAVASQVPAVRRQLEKARRTAQGG